VAFAGEFRYHSAVSKTDAPARAAPEPLFPEAADMADWNALSPAEQLALIERAEQDGFDSGDAEPESLVERLARVRSR
jgi:hypothetical protein